MSEAGDEPMVDVEEETPVVEEEVEMSVLDALKEVRERPNLVEFPEGMQTMR